MVEMAFNDVNLLEMLFPDHDTDDANNSDDIGRLRMNEIFNAEFNDISKYYDLESYNTSLTCNDNSSLNVIHFNIRDLITNKDELETNISLMSRTPDVISLSETWLNSSHESEVNIQGYNIYNIVRPTLRGGVTLLVRDNLESSMMEKFSFVTTEIEICTVSVKIKNENYTISAIYRPHFKYDNIKEFRKAIEPILNDKMFKKSKTILTGDFNINLLEHQTHADTNDFLVFMQNLFYLPVISRPTRFPEGHQRALPSLLDHIYINFSPPAISGILK